MNPSSRKCAVWYSVFTILLMGFCFDIPAALSAETELSSLELLGKKLFFDPDLSVNRSQSCAGCHDPGTGFSGPDSEINVHGAVEPGAVPDRFGNRKPPTAAYGA